MRRAAAQVPVRLAAASQKPFNGLPRAETIGACSLVGGASAMKLFLRIVTCNLPATLISAAQTCPHWLTRMIVSSAAGREGGR